MKVFISWSGERSKALAEGLRDWLRSVIQASVPWMSSVDIGAGERWTQEVDEALQEAQLGIICVTRSNQHAPWILFEAGAIAKSVQRGRVIPLLFDLPKTELRQPLALFQAVLADRDGIFNLIETVNRELSESGKALPPDILRTVFDRAWTDFEKLLDDVGIIEEPQVGFERAIPGGPEHQFDLEDRVRRLEAQLSQRDPDAQDRRRLAQQKAENPEDFVRGKLWPVGRTIRVAFLGGTNERHNKVKRAAAEWTNYANLTFEFVDSGPSDIRISFREDQGNWSYVGTDNLSIPENQPSMNFSSLESSAILQQFGHALGLGNEHQNPTARILWQKEEVIRELTGPPNFWAEEMVQHNIFQQYSYDHLYGGIEKPYDPLSVMHRPFPESWVEDGKGITENKKLSEGDKTFIATLYPFSDSS